MRHRFLSIRHKLKGFTLLEVLIALAIFAYTGVAIINSTGSHMKFLSITEDSIIAAWVAENRLAELQLEEVWPPKNNKTGKEKLAGREWFWKQEVKKVQNDNMRQVSVLISDTEAFESVVYELKTYVGNRK